MNLDGIIKINLKNRKFCDNRGCLLSLWNNLDCNITFIEDRISKSRMKVLRGFHGDFKTWKLIACLAGIFDLHLIDIRSKSPTFLQKDKIEMSFGGYAILVPPGVLNAHEALNDQVILWYKWSERYDGPKNQITLNPYDPNLNIDWVFNQHIISDRDSNAKNIKEVLNDTKNYNFGY